MSLSAAVFKCMAKQAVDCRNMVVTIKGCVIIKVWHTHTTVMVTQKLHSTYFNVLYEHLIIGRKTRIIHVFYYWT